MHKGATVKTASAFRDMTFKAIQLPQNMPFTYVEFRLLIYRLMLMQKNGQVLRPICKCRRYFVIIVDNKTISLGIHWLRDYLGDGYNISPCSQDLEQWRYCEPKAVQFDSLFTILNGKL